MSTARRRMRPRSRSTRAAPFIDLCRGPARARTRGRSAPRPSSCSTSPAPTGAATPTARCCSASTARRLRSPKELREHLNWLEEVKKRDHRQLVKELDLFSFHEEAGPGLVYWHPQGRDDAQDHRGLLARPPHGGRLRLRLHAAHRQSVAVGDVGHLDFYRENMYAPMDVDGQDYYLKPMNCPFHIMIYKIAAALLPRAAAALGGAGHGLPLREERRAARAAARARLHAGRRAHHLHAGPDRGRDAARAALLAVAAARLRLRGHPGVPLDAAGEGRGRARALGAGAGIAQARHRRGGAGLRGGRGRRRVLRPQDRPARSRMRWAASGSSRRSSSTSTCRSAST